jgi:hypothetical protein
MSGTAQSRRSATLTVGLALVVAFVAGMAFGILRTNDVTERCIATLRAAAQ